MPRLCMPRKAGISERGSRMRRDMSDHGSGSVRGRLGGLLSGSVHVAAMLDVQDDDFACLFVDSVEHAICASAR